MHEFSIAQAIGEQLDDLSREMHLSRIVKIHLKVGVMRGVIAEALELALQAVFEDYPVFQSAQVTITMVPVQIRCQQCQSVSVLDELVFHCPDCGAMTVEVLAGKDLDIDTIEAE